MIRTVVSASPREQPFCAHFRLREGVLLIVAEDFSGRLIDLSGEVVAISPSGARMLEGVLAKDADAVCRELAQIYDVDAARIRRDLDAFLISLDQRRLLIPPGAARRDGRSIGAALSWLAAPLLLACRARPRRLILAKAHVLLAAAFLSTRLFGWSNTVRVWTSSSRGGRSVRGCRARAEAETLDAIDANVARALASHPFGVSCKERALCCHVLARALGAESRVLIGVDSFPFALHCWCECNARILADRVVGRCDRFTPVVAYS
jgi:hypothetical protein